MATTCEACGHRDNEVKGGSGIEEKGTRIKLKITDPTDLSRDVLKVWKDGWVFIVVPRTTLYFETCGWGFQGNCKATVFFLPILQTPPNLSKHEKFVNKINCLFFTRLDILFLSGTFLYIYYGPKK